MSARFYADGALMTGTAIALPDQAARHVQVLRLQPGDDIILFNGQGPEGQYQARIERIGRSDVEVVVGAFSATQREAPRAVHLAIGMPANERMDWLVEKATELGVASIRPLMAERSVLRLKGDRSEKKLAHWRGIAVAACEQCGRNRVPIIHASTSISQWLKTAFTAATPAGGMDGDMTADSPAGTRLLLSLQQDTTRPLAEAIGPPLLASSPLTFLSGPEGGLTPSEEAAAIASGFAPVTLGPRVLRAETAPLAVLSFLGLLQG